MEMKFDVVYEIKEVKGWRAEKGGIEIKSNIADDELVQCELSKSLVEHLKKNATILEPDKLLLGIAEAQKREIEQNLEALDDMALTAKNRADSVQQNLLKIYEDSEKKYNELAEKFMKTKEKFTDKLISTQESISTDMEKLEILSKRLIEINSYDLSRLSDAIQTIVNLAEQDSELVKLVLNHKKI